MKHKMITINAGCNCYLIETSIGYLLIDTGLAAKRVELDQELANAGCVPGKLQLIIVTHGDTDHSANARYLREKYGADIAMHADDFGMVERGDMKWNRKSEPDRISPTLKQIIESPANIARSLELDKFTPDLAVDDGFSLVEYGFEARILHIPGHSKGSIGVLTDEGDLFCGDLMYNSGPDYYYSDDMVAYNATLDRLKMLAIKIVYPGHGQPFPFEKKIAD